MLPFPVKLLLFQKSEWKYFTFGADLDAKILSPCLSTSPSSSPSHPLSLPSSLSLLLPLYIAEIWKILLYKIFFTSDMSKKKHIFQNTSENTEVFLTVYFSCYILLIILQIFILTSYLL